MEKGKKGVLCFCMIFLFLGIAGLLWAGMYDAPSSDDYEYALQTRAAWDATHSVVEVIRAAALTSGHYWHTWQGLYSSAFIQALMPDIFGAGAYAVTAFLTIGFLMAGNTVLMETLAAKVLGVNRVEQGILVTLCNLAVLQWMPSAVEGLYWYNGAMNYTFYYALTQIAVSIMIRYTLWNSARKDAAALTGLAALGIWIEGGNHVTAVLLLTLFLGFMVLGICLKKRKLYYLAIPFLASLAGFFFNILSPGTKIRQAQFPGHPGIFLAIKASIGQTLSDLNDWMNFGYLLLLLAAVPILMTSAARFCEKTKWRFPCPLLVVIASAGCLCLMRSLPYYAMGGPGMGRLTNIIYFAFVPLSMLDVFYLLGWLYAKDLINAGGGHMVTESIWLCTLLLLLVSFAADNEENNFYRAYSELHSGELRQYAVETEERRKVLLDQQISDAVLRPYSVTPSLLYLQDIAGNGRAMAQYYEKQSVALQKP